METRQPCGCGCGQPAPEGKSYVHNHWPRSEHAKQVHRARRMKREPANPSGYCMCGCGRKTKIATHDRLTRGYRKGEHLKYILGHQVPHGEANPAWKGGRTIRRGYVYVLAPEHPYADSKGYVAEHRIVAGNKVGRILQPHEHVHHINGNGLDNHPDNLVVLTAHRHGRIHGGQLQQWYADLSPDERRKLRQAFGRLGAEARWNPQDPGSSPEASFPTPSEPPLPSEST